MRKEPLIQPLTEEDKELLKRAEKFLKFGKYGDFLIH